MRLPTQKWRTAAQAGTEVGVVAAAWTALFWLNDCIFSEFAISKNVSWVFLPAAIRILAVMVADWRGVCGLFIGGITTSLMMDARLQHFVPLSLASALAPFIALHVSKKYLKLSSTLDSITPHQVIAISAVGALCSSVLHSSFYALTDASVRFFHNVVQMFVGDLLGTALVLAAVSAALKVTHNTKP